MQRQRPAARFSVATAVRVPQLVPRMSSALVHMVIMAKAVNIEYHLADTLATQRHSMMATTTAKTATKVA